MRLISGPVRALVHKDLRVSQQQVSSQLAAIGQKTVKNRRIMQHSLSTTTFHYLASLPCDIISHFTLI